MADRSNPKCPPNATALLVLSDGSIFEGRGFGAPTTMVGEICFNTAMTGYQEVLTDPSYAGQIINFTFPHIGIVGANEQDVEGMPPRARGMICRERPEAPSSWRAQESLEAWMTRHGLPGICDIDTRALTRRIRDLGAPNGVLCHHPEGVFDRPALIAQAKSWPGLEGMDLAAEVTCTAPYDWHEGVWAPEGKYDSPATGPYTVVAIDYGIKRNILRMLVSAGCRVRVVPATTSAADILSMKPDGVFLSNGPGDPAATGRYAVPVIQALIDANIPIFGICLGHQLTALALGGQTQKMALGHRGANHPVKDLTTGKVEITSQNHGFMVLPDTLPSDTQVTHVSLFDSSNEGLKSRSKPLFSIQYHPESSPGPSDSQHLFDRFVEMMKRRNQNQPNLARLSK